MTILMKHLKIRRYTESFCKADASKEGLTGLNKRRRANEILENMRDPDIKEESEQYGLRTTYQNVPEGMLGAMASAVAQVSYPAVQAGQDIPPAKQALATVSQFFIPFIRVVANVQNMIADFTPGLGAVKAELYYRYGTNVVRSKGKSITTEQYKDLHVRHMMATTLAGALYYLFFSEEEDEENRLFDVTAGGPKKLSEEKNLMEGGIRPYTVRIRG